MVGVKPRLAVFCCLALLGMIAGSCNIGDENGEKWFVVTGTVTDSATGLPIASASMSWGDTVPGAPVSLTDSSGRYRLQTPQSANTVYARKDSYESRLRTIPPGTEGGSTLANFDFMLQSN